MILPARPHRPDRTTADKPIRSRVMRIWLFRLAIQQRKPMHVGILETGIYRSNPARVYEIRHCSANISWEKNLGTCPSLTSSSGAMITYDQSASNSVPGQYLPCTSATVQCSPGYQLSGSITVSCQSNGQWSNQLGQCTRKGPFNV